MNKEQFPIRYTKNLSKNFEDYPNKYDVLWELVCSGKTEFKLSSIKSHIGFKIEKDTLMNILNELDEENQIKIEGTKVLVQ